MRFGLILALLLLTAVPAVAQDPARIQSDVREGQRLMAEGRPAEAEPLFARAAADALTLWGDTSPDAGSLSLLHANAVEDQGRLVEAEGLYRDALASLERATEAGHPWRGWALNDLGLNLHKQGRHAEALELTTRAVDLRSVTEGPDAPPTLTSLNNLASILRALGRFQESADVQRRILAVREATLPPDHPDLGLTLNNLGAVLLDLDRPVEAEATLRRAAAVRDVALGPDHALTAQTRVLLAEALARNGRLDAAWEMQGQAIAALERAGDATDLAAALSAHADLALTLGRPDEALVVAERALALRKAALPPDHPDVAGSLTVLADVHLAAGRPDRALPLLEEALALTRRALGPDHVNALRILSLLGLTQGELGRGDRALAHLADAAALADRTLPPGHLGRLATTADHGAALAAARRPLDALPLLRRAGAGLIDRRQSSSAAATEAETDALRHLWRLTVTASWDAAHSD
ncbi:tetratricopeptide repeat protein [Brevundimonas sp.]|jgi:tetratricopeptide (TPR) repeat protein|uniref:tetratricopeptide repeat protein n=1 Tax=Brevundimonas sp. TaxID=1871086 RepID=UPI002E163E58|nr:tetratricopeptide repeat protein [Brevundimonas sp.]